MHVTETGRGTAERKTGRGGWKEDADWLGRDRRGDEAQKSELGLGERHWVRKLLLGCRRAWPGGTASLEPYHSLPLHSAPPLAQVEALATLG